jgi:hypothetical protein
MKILCAEAATGVLLRFVVHADCLPMENLDTCLHKDNASDAMVVFLFNTLQTIRSLSAARV